MPVVFFNLSWGPDVGDAGRDVPEPDRAVGGRRRSAMDLQLRGHGDVPDAAGRGLAATYGIYLVAAIISVIFVVRHVHETKGKELEQMEG